MPRITKVTTKKGDAGETSLGSGQRVPKDSPRTSAYGTVDELNAVIGVVVASDVDDEVRTFLSGVQNDLFHLGADLCIPQEDKERFPGPRIEQRHILALEECQDRLAEALEPLSNFVLPGGTAAAAHLHLGRTVCRRAERRVVTLAREEEVAPENIRYLNRLSDLLFTMSRYENRVKGVDEPLWDSRA